MTISTMALVVLVVPASGMVINVPADQPTIQAAITAASPGDEIVLADGIYTGLGNKNLNPSGKDVVVRSANGPLSCTINLENSGRAFLFANGETQNMVVEGIAIIRGDVPFDFGGAIYIQNASPYIKDCVFYENQAGFDGGAIWILGGAPIIEDCTFNLNNALDYGGAMYLLSTFASIRSCSFSTNNAGKDGGAVFVGAFCNMSFQQCGFDNNTALAGGAVFFSGSAGGPAGSTTSGSFWQCDFDFNTSTGTAALGGAAAVQIAEASVDVDFSRFNFNVSDHHGGGILVELGSTVSIEGVDFEENEATQFGGAVYSDNSDLTVLSCFFQGQTANTGGGIFNYNGNLTVTSSIFENNSAVRDGGAINSSAGSFSTAPLETWILQSEFYGNTADIDGGAISFAAGLVDFGMDAEVRNSLFSANSSLGTGGAIFTDGSDLSVDIHNSTFNANDSAGLGKTIEASTVSGLSVFNSILVGAAAEQITPASGVRVIRSLVTPPFTGSGMDNITGDPMFADPDGFNNTIGTRDDDLQLTYGSPCVDAGYNSFVPGGMTVDVDNLPRIIDDPWTPDTGLGTPPVIDMGAHEFVNTGTATPATPVNSRLHAAAPNPFNPSTVIRYDLPQPGFVELSIYDLSGRRVRTLVHETRAAGRHDVVWRGLDDNGRQVASGVYLYRLEAGSYVETRQTTLLK